MGAARGPRPKPRQRVVRVELAGELDAHAAEAFALEVRRLAALYARDATSVQITTSTVRRTGRLA